jgi:hypothetical protein
MTKLTCVYPETVDFGSRQGRRIPIYSKYNTWSKDKYRLYDKCVIIANLRCFCLKQTNPAKSSNFAEPILFSKFGLQYTFLCNTKELPHMIALIKYN